MAQLLRFGFVGLVNTALGYSLILAALYAGANDYLANAIGYAAGITVGYFLNKKFVFNASKFSDKAQFTRYLIAVAISYMLNLAVVWLGVNAGYAGSPLVHLAAMVCYSVMQFILSKYFVFQTSKEEQALGLSGDVLLIMGLSIPALYFLTSIPVSHDVAWQFWVARQMLGGVELYAQINEVNPPLWFWMALPVQILADALSVSAIKLNNVLLIFLTALVALVSARLLPDDKHFNKTGFAGAVFVIACLTSLQSFAQREHFALLVALPYALLIGRRVSNHPVNLWLALSIGVFAAFGFAMKHYLIVVPVILELYVLYRTRSLFRSFRPETVALAGCAILYAAAVFVFSPAFIDVQLPINLAFYGDFGTRLSAPLVALWNNNFQPLVWVMLVPVFVLNRWNIFRDQSEAHTAVLIALVGFFIAYCLQAKGFGYHAIPVSFFAILLFAMQVISSKNHTRSLIKSTAIAIMIAGIIGVFISTGSYFNKYRAGMETALKDTPKGSTVYVLASFPSQIWPMIDDLEYEWPSSFFSFWTYNGMLQAENKSANSQALSQDIMQTMVDDLRCNMPAVFLVSNHPGRPVEGKGEVTFLDLFLTYKPARDWFANYSLTSQPLTDPPTYLEYSVYTLNTDSASSAPRLTNCRKVF